MPGRENRARKLSAAEVKLAYANQLEFRRNYNWNFCQFELLLIRKLKESIKMFELQKFNLQRFELQRFFRIFCRDLEILFE